MDSASEKGALLQGLCPGISCVFNTRVQLFDWMTVKWVLSLWIIWLLPSLWQQVLRLRLQDNNFILHPPPPSLVALRQQKFGAKSLNQKVGKNTGGIWQDSSGHWNKQDACKQRMQNSCSRRCLQTSWVSLTACHSYNCCLHFLSFLSSPLTLANLETIRNGNTQHEGGGRIVMKCRVSSQRHVGRRRVLQTKYSIRNITSHKVHPAVAWLF